MLRDADAPVGVVISGEPGVGKTILWRVIVDAAVASGWRVLSTTGIRSEVDAPLANLVDLLDPAARDVLAQLPRVQADALGAALKFVAATGALDEALVGRATVNAVRALARDRLLIAIDDEQWLDPDSRRLLATVAVRLQDVSLTWLVAVRAAQAETGLARVLAHELGSRLTWLSLSGLNEELLTRLIVDAVPCRWSPQLLRHVVELAAGNPYAALELAREAAASQGRDARAAQVPASLADSLLARLRRLAPTTLTAVQAAALARRPTRLLLRSVVGDQADGAIDDALEADVLDAAPPDPALRFSHPLLREVAQASLSGPQRRRLHRRFAAAVDDPDEAAGHLAAGAEEPDEELARIVAEAAERVASKGAPARAATLAEAAVALTPDRDGLPAWRRRLLELDCLKEASEFDRARTLAEQWATSVPLPMRGELTARRGGLEPDFAVAAELLTEAFDELGHDPARAALVGTDLAVVTAIHLLQLDKGRVFAKLAVEQARRTNDPVVLRRALAVEGLFAALAGQPAAQAILRSAVALPGLARMSSPYYSPETRLAMWHMWRGEVEPARELYNVVLQAAENCGSEDSANGIRLHLVEVEWRAGRWAQAAALAVSVDGYMRRTGAGQPGAPAYVLSLMAAARGETDRARIIAIDGVRDAEQGKDFVFAIQCRSVLGQLELSVDDPVAAIKWLEPIVQPFRNSGLEEPGLFGFWPDMIEAYARVGRVDNAIDQLKWLQAAAIRLDHPWARVTSRRAAAIVEMAVGDLQAAMDAASIAVDEIRQRGLPFELGRCLLVLGTVQRRIRRRREAAHTLTEAIAIFDRLGAPRWAALAQAQRAHLDHSSTDVLTPAEKRVAGLVAQGLTNNEIAAALLVSVKTVETNLTRIYRKIGIRRRVDLARRFSETEPR
jgi:DNA-binding CsgD family transcriptional regulator